MALLLSGASLLHAQDVTPRPVQPPDPSSSDSMATAALRASLLGDADRVRELAEARLEWESARRVKPEFVVSERLAILAESSKRWLPPDRLAKQSLRGFPRTDATTAFRESLRGAEPREVLRNATATRVYESRRRAFNSLIGAFAGVLRLQFFGLVQLPLDAAESIVSGRPYLNPEQRRELRAARGVLLDRPTHAPAMRVVRDYERRRLRLAVEHAEANAERAEKLGRLDTAVWWMERATILSAGEWTPPKRLRDLDTRIAGQDNARTQSIFVREAPVDDREEAWLRWVLASLDGPAEAEGRTPLHELDGNSLGGDVRAAIIAVRRDKANPSATIKTLQAIAATDHPAWAARARGYLDAATFDPRRRVAEAQSDLRTARRAFVLWADDPTIGTKSLSPESARLGESKWITAARSLFVVDMLGRFITLPLLPSGTFSRDGVLNAAGSASPEFLATDDGERILRAKASALSRMRRHGQASAAWAELGEVGKAQKSRERAARHLERLARETPSYEGKAVVLRRLLRGWPATPAARRAVVTLRETEQELAVLAEATSDEVNALLRTWSEAGWQSPATQKQPTVRFMDSGSIQWRIKRRDEWRSVEIAEETFDRMIASLREVRLSGRVATALDEPRERKRVPLLLDASAFPGFDFTPGLVPVDIPGSERRLYE